MRPVMPPEFRTSSYCTASECVAVAAAGGTVRVRDAAGTILAFPAAAWAAFTARPAAAAP